MRQNKELNRLSRLTAILLQLQTRRLTTAPMLSEKFDVSLRTIYRDVRALEQAGVPIIMEEGKGYSLMEGYCIPPVSFTESEANALITAEQLILDNRDASLIKEFSKAILKIKAGLRHSIREKADLLKDKIIIRQNTKQEKSSSYLSILQLSLTNFLAVEIKYSDENNKLTRRILEPFALYNEGENWLLFAYCRLRKDFRVFRLDRIQSLSVLDEKFEPHKMTFEEFIDKQYSTPDIRLS